MQNWDPEKLSKHYWVIACAGCSVRRGQNTLIMILGVGQGKTPIISHLSESTFRVVGSTLLSSLAVLPNEIFLQKLISSEKDRKNIVVPKCIFILFTFQMPAFSFVGWPVCSVLLSTTTCPDLMVNQWYLQRRTSHGERAPPVSCVIHQCVLAPGTTYWQLLYGQTPDVFCSPLFQNRIHSNLSQKWEAQSQ